VVLAGGSCLGAYVVGGTAVLLKEIGSGFRVKRNADSRNIKNKKSNVGEKRKAFVKGKKR